MAPKISVVMPTHNAERFLASAIESVLTQDYSDFEFIVVDDASTDATPMILQHYTNLDSRLRVLRNERNRGAPYSRNRGIMVCSGEYVATFDSDDLCMPDRLSTQVRRMQEHDEVGVIGSSIFLIDEINRVIGFRRYPTDDQLLRRNMFKFSPFAAPSTMIRKTTLLNAGLYDEELGGVEDIDLWFRIGRIAKFANCREVLLKYRLHAASTTFRGIRRMNALTFKIRMRAMRDYGYPTSTSTIIQLFGIRLLTFFLPAGNQVYLFEKVRERILRQQDGCRVNDHSSYPEAQT
jgi:glycosyltransferase involved in cell wall biosynthesis